MPNDNISFNSIDDLQHFRTTEDVFETEGRMMDSGHFLTEPVKRDAGDAFGPPLLTQAENTISLPQFDDTVIGSIPIVNSSTSSAEVTDLIHLNVQYNPSSFGVVPVFNYFL